MIIRSRAPLRFSFGGAATDFREYFEKHGGAVLHGAISLYSFTTIEPRNDNKIIVNAIDLGINEELKERTIYDGRLDLVKATLNKFNVPEKGANFHIHSTTPLRSGLGGSSVAVVSLVGAVKEWVGKQMTKQDIANMACNIERDELKIPGGLQDQYAAAFGGINFVEFTKDKIVVNKLKLPDDLVNELNYRLLICYIGERKVSGLINRHIEAVNTKPHVFHEIKKIAYQMRDSLVAGDLEKLGMLWNEEWETKKQMAEGISNDRLDKLFKIAKSNGVIGGRVDGAGGGGHMILLCDYKKKHDVAKALTKEGVIITPFSFDFQGLTTWMIK